MSIESININTLKGFIDYLRLRIETLPKQEIGYLEATITGYTFANYDQMNWFSGFSNFITQKIGIGPSEKGWKSLILEKSNNNEVKALNMFFELFDEYAELNKK